MQNPPLIFTAEQAADHDVITRGVTRSALVSLALVLVATAGFAHLLLSHIPFGVNALVPLAVLQLAMWGLGNYPTGAPEALIGARGVRVRVAAIRATRTDRRAVLRTQTGEEVPLAFHSPGEPVTVGTTGTLYRAGKYAALVTSAGTHWAR